MNETDAKTYWRTLTRDDPATALVLAKAAPSVVAPWVRSNPEFVDCHCWRPSPWDGPMLAIVDDLSDGLWRAVVYDGSEMLRLGDYFTQKDARAACDTKLRELGYLLEDS